MRRDLPRRRRSQRELLFDPTCYGLADDSRRRQSCEIREAKKPLQRIEDNNIGIGKSARAAKFRFQEIMNALDLIPHDLGRRIPDAQFLAKLWIERFKDRLIEIRDRRYARLAGNGSFAIGIAGDRSG